MCEQTPVEYKNGDIVWVKLGPCWWPGEVQDLQSIDETIISSFKKPLIAAVKFFNEDTYAYIRSLDQIYSYNCTKKNEFIKKGLDLCRAKHEYMRKFPEDVCKAEIETNGNPNIMDDPIFAPEQRVNVVALLFGNSKQKKTPRRSSGSPRKSVGSKATANSPKTSGKKIITHPRFVGHCDHEVKICVQAANRLISDSEEERNMYTCTMCAFSTDRIGVIIPHHKSHLYSYGTASIHTSKKRKNTPVKGNKKLRMTKSKTSSILEDLDLIEKGLLVQTESSDERDDTLESNCDNESEIKRKPKRTKKKLKEQEPKKLKTIVDVCGDLLAEWNDESEEFGSEAALDVTSSTEDSQLPNTELKDQNRGNQKGNEKVDDDLKKDDKSCFDFEEDDINEIIGTSLHRKIPRVIPPPERPRSANSEEIKDNSSSSENNVDVMQDGSTQLQTTNDDVTSTQSQNTNNDVCSAELQGTDELCPAQSQDTNEVCSAQSQDTNEICSAQSQGTDEVCSAQLQDTVDDVCSAQPQDIKDICSAQSQGTKDDVCSGQSQGTDADVCLPQSQGTNDDLCLPQSQGTNDDVCLPQSQGISDDVCLPQSQGTNDDICLPQSQSTNDDVCLPQSQGTNDDVCSTQSQGTNDDVCSAQSRDTNDDVCSSQSPDTNDDVCSSQSQDTNDDVSSAQSQDTNDEVCSAQSQDTNDDVCSAQLRNINDDGVVEFNNQPNQDNLECLETIAVQEIDKSQKQRDTSNLVNEIEEQELIPNKTNTKEHNDVEVKDDDTDELAFKNMLEATSMPELPEMPHSLKFEQNLHDSKKIKFPDKQTPSTPPKTEVKETCTSSRLINPKKRFVKSFEDFEQQINKEQKKLLEQHEKVSENIESDNVVVTVDSALSPKVTDKVLEKTSTVKVSKLKTQLMYKLGNVEGIEETTKQTKRPQLLRDRILTSHREDNLDEPLNFINISNEIETSTIDDMILNNTVDPQYPQKICELPEELLQACNSLHVESTAQPDLMPVIKIAEIDGEQQRENKENLSQSPNLVEAPTTEAPGNTNIVNESEARKYHFKRRFSAQIFEPVESKVMEVQNIQINVDENQHLESTNLQLTTTVQEEKLNKVEENLTEIVVDTEPVLETESNLKSEPIFKSQPVLETETVLGIEPCLETGPMLESEPTLQTEPVLESEPTLQTEPILESEPILQTEPVLETEMILETEIVLNTETEPILDTKPITETGTSSVSETESISESEPVSDTGLVLEGELVSKTEEMSKTVPEASEHCADLIKIAHSLHTEGEDAGEKSAVESNQNYNLNSENVIHTSIVESKIEETDNQSINCVGVMEDVNSSAMIESNISFSCANLDNQNADLSALTTLATISELSTNLDVKCTSSSEKTKIIENNLTSTCVDIRDKNNINFVTVDDLADAQVEISDSSISKVKSIPINLASFSVDFPESHQTASDSYESISKSILIQEEVVEQVSQPDSIEMSLGKVFEGENDSESKPYKSDPAGILENDHFDLEDHIPSLLVCNSKSLLGKKFKTILSERSKPEYSSSSKLLEILTDSKPKCSLDSDALQSSPDTETRDISEKQVICKETVVTSNKNVTKSKEEKCEKISNIIKENNSVSKMTLKLKDDKSLHVSKETSSVSKVLSKNKDDKPYTITKESSVAKNLPKSDSKVILKSSVLKSFGPTSLSKSSKPIILSEKIIKTMLDSSETVSVQKVTSKRSTQDVEDIDTFIIQKPPKKIFLSESAEVETFPKKMSRGRAKILQQTIIKPSGDIIQPAVTSLDDTMFDINSMPIVLGDQILTTEVIESMPVVISETQEVVTTKPQTEQKLLNKPTSTQPMLLNTYSSQKLGKSRIYHTTPTSATKILKSNPAIISRPGKQDKYIILPSSTAASTSKYTVGKKTMTKRMAPVIVPTSNIAQKIQTTTMSESSGNKIMIVTNQQGQQSRVLLTPAQQKLFGYQSTGSKLVKSAVKSNILQKTTARSSVVTTISTVQTKVSQTITNSQEGLTPSNPNLTTELVSLKPTNTLRNVKTVSSKGGRLQIQQQKGLQEGFSSFKNQSKTIVIKNQQGQIVKKLHTDDSVLEQQVAEQVQAIKASSSTINTCSKIKSPTKRSYKKSEPQKNVKLVSSAAKLLKTEIIPPLAPISPKRTDSLLLSQTILKTPENSSDGTKPESSQKPLSQLIIQDALGNQTSIMEGQILALPSGETLDGQPQSYMLVTLDESGNLTPLNNEALLSLDPNLTLGGDLSNMVLQVDDSVNKKSGESNTSNNESAENLKIPETLPPQKVSTKTESETPQNVQTVTCSIGNDLNQQLIITGDPITAQKFIESLTEANPDLANLLASAEGNILIQTDEQQILINTDSDNQLLLPINAGVVDNEGDSNPIFATQPVKNQDILAAALADTDVFQQEHTVSPVHSKITQQAQLSPNSGLYQAGVANVLETTLSLSSPIMTPLEVPSTNNKKIPDEEMDILTTEVPKNVDLPITITDPNISQTVAQQQVASLMASELSTNLDLPLTIAETVVTPLSSAELSSPSYVYPLSTLDESVANVDVQKSFSGPISMPLLTEDPQETISDPILEQSEVPEHIIEQKSENRNVESAPKRYVKKRLQELPEERSILGRLKRRNLFESSPLTDSIIRDDRRSPPKAFLVGGLDTEEGLCTLGGAMCSSLSEPPPDMFDLSIVTSHFDKSLLHRSLRTENESNRVDSSTELNESNDGFNKYQYPIGNKIKPSSLLSIPEISSSNSPVVNVDENSCEIPVQPQIVTDLSSTSFGCMDVVGFETNKRVGCDYNNDHDRKKMKFD